jgi:hypothetical protein
MTKQEILRYLVQHARRNGFEFRAWFRAALDTPWTTFDAAIEYLAVGRRYYSLLFSHEFARHFWKPGTQASFLVPAVSYTYVDRNGKVLTVNRKAYVRRTIKADFWRYHLGEMAQDPHPLKYIRRFVVRKEDIEDAQREQERVVRQQQQDTPPQPLPGELHPRQARSGHPTNHPSRNR